MRTGPVKSTMMKMLAEVETPSSGEILLDGKVVSLNSTHQAEKQGISIIFQELNLFPNMNVMDNIFIANEFFQRGVINEKYGYALAKSLLLTGCNWMSIPMRRWANWALVISSW